MTAQRNTRTKQAIQHAFTEIVAEKGIDGLSMSDVARRAGINRGTVYLHYTDKFDMLQQLEDEAIAEITAILFSHAGERSEGALHTNSGGTVRTAGSKDNADSAGRAPKPNVCPEAASDLITQGTIKEALDYVKARLDFFIALTGENGDPMFVEKFKRVLARYLQGDEESGAVPPLWRNLPPDYAREALLGSTQAILTLWLRKGTVESTEEIARMLEQAKNLSPTDLLA